MLLMLPSTQAFYVDTPRANDAAMLIIGDPVVQAGNSMTAPYATGHLKASEAEISRQQTCPGACTADFSTTINVFAQFYHMHNYGSAMFTEKYATAEAGGENLGIVGGRIDFWDNGYQQALPAQYTVAPGETLCVRMHRSTCILRRCVHMHRRTCIGVHA